jgi:hypothetical protein
MNTKIDFSNDSIDDLIKRAKDFMGDDFTFEGWTRSELIDIIEDHYDNEEDPHYDKEGNLTDEGFEYYKDEYDSED